MPVPVDMSRPRLNVEFIGLYTGQNGNKTHSNYWDTADRRVRTCRESRKQITRKGRNEFKTVDVYTAAV